MATGRLSASGAEDNGMAYREPPLRMTPSQGVTADQLCAGCRRPFKARRITQQHCGHRCRTAAWRRRKTDESLDGLSQAHDQLARRSAVRCVGLAVIYIPGDGQVRCLTQPTSRSLVDPDASCLDRMELANAWNRGS